MLGLLLRLLRYIWSFCFENFPSNFPNGPPETSRPEPYCSDVESYESFDLTLILGDKTGKKYAVIGGSGQVGKAIVRLLQARGENVRVVDVAPPSNLEAEFVKGDMTNADSISSALDGVHIVFLVAAAIRYQEVGEVAYAGLHKINVSGTANVLQVARNSKTIEGVVQTSTGYLVHGYENASMDTYDEETRYTVHPFNAYVSTKIAAEKMTRSFNGTKSIDGRKIHTCSVRPCSVIYSSEDNGSWFKRYRLFYQSILKKPGKKYTFLSDMVANKWDDYVYADNLAFAHVLAADNLSSVGGEVFCISDGVFKTDDMTTAILRDSGAFPYDRISRPSPTQLVMWSLALFSYLAQEKLGWGYKQLGELQLITPAVIDMCMRGRAVLQTTAHAEDLLGWRPIYSRDVAVRKIGDELKKWYGPANGSTINVSVHHKQA